MSDHRRLLETINYDPETGNAIYRVRSGVRAPGSRVGFIKAGSKRSKPYRYVRIGWLFQGQKPFTHVIHFYMTGCWPKDEIDHIHGDTLDDRWSELRESTREQNEANRGPRRSNTTGLKGVHNHQDRFYKAAIWRDGKRTYLGTHKTPQEAHAAYTAAAKEHDGEFARVT